MTSSATPAELADGLREAIRGPVLLNGDSEFDASRAVWNGMYDRRPRVIVRCTGTVDVQRAIDFARDYDLPLAVRGGGHSYSGASSIDDGMLLDLSLMAGVSVDPIARTATAQGGALWNLFDRETQGHGLATTAGVISHTGVGGLTLGGGVGRLMRKHGLTCDNVISFEIVTAESEVLRVDREHNEDLDWALRGGGGNFGVVTKFEYELHPLGPTVLAGSLGWPAERAGEALASCKGLMDDAPRDLFLQMMYTTAPRGLNYIPDNMQGKPVVMVNLFWAGDIDKGEQLFSTARAKGPSFDTIGPVRYDELQSSIDVMAPHGRRAYIKSGYFKTLTEGHIAAAAEVWSTFPSQYSLLEFVMMGGKVSDVGTEETAFAGREAGYLLGAIALWDESASDARALEWCRKTEERFEPLVSKGLYINMSSDEAADVYESTGAANYARLAEVKGKYDPENVFKHNPNIRPAMARV